MITLWTWPLLAVSLSSVVGAESSLKLSKHCRQREHAMASSALFCCKKIWRLWWLSTHPIQLYCPMLEENAGKLTRLSMSFPEQKVFLKTCVGMCRSSWNTVRIELWTSFGWSLSCANLRPWLIWTLRPEALRYFHAGRSAHPSNEAQSNLLQLIYIYILANTDANVLPPFSPSQPRCYLFAHAIACVDGYCTEFHKCHAR